MVRITCLIYQWFLFENTSLFFQCFKVLYLQYMGVKVTSFFKNNANSTFVLLKLWLCAEYPLNKEYNCIHK